MSRYWTVLFSYRSVPYWFVLMMDMMMSFLWTSRLQHVTLTDILMFYVAVFLPGSWIFCHLWMSTPGFQPFLFLVAAASWANVSWIGCLRSTISRKALSFVTVIRQPSPVALPSPSHRHTDPQATSCPPAPSRSNHASCVCTILLSPNICRTFLVVWPII